MANLQNLTIAVILLPLIAGIIAGIGGKIIGKRGAHSITIIGVAIAFLLALQICRLIFLQQAAPLDNNWYTWGISGSFQFYLGFLIDPLSATLMAVVTFVSLVVHIYSIGYMQDDDGYQRFFSYISLFTFAMLMLVSANNFLQLFFGWEGVGLISYLLIGFWFKKESANFGSLKAFIVNRVGDFGFILGIAAILDYCGSLQYGQVFGYAPGLATQTITLLPHVSVSVLTLICILLFIGAMGKSAQMPLHVWLPESMEGPTPISALIHAATMVTAGIYLVARLSPLYEYSTAALSMVLVIGASGALFTGLIGLVQNDIKRVVAYSTLSQLGYMMAALGASAYSVGIFHLITHAFFKALLFLAAGSVILAMHHDQDMRRMGGLWRYMPVTYITFLIGACALSAIPPFAGFYSKDLIIEVVQQAHIPGATYAFWCVAIGAFVTPLYIFRAFFMTFHGTPRFEAGIRQHLHEAPWVVTLPLILLAVPSLLAGVYLIDPLVFQNVLGNSLFVLPVHNTLSAITFNGAWQMAGAYFFHSPYFYVVFAAILLAWLAYVRYPQLPGWAVQRLHWLYFILMHKYGFDAFNEYVWMRGTRWAANLFFTVGDVRIVDNTLVDGSGRTVTRLAKISRRLQSGYLYHYALVMLVAVLVLLCWMMME